MQLSSPLVPAVLSFWLNSVERARDLRYGHVEVIDLRHEEHGSFGEKFLEAILDSSDILLSRKDDKEIFVVSIVVCRSIFILLWSGCCNKRHANWLVSAPWVEGGARAGRIAVLAAIVAAKWICIRTRARAAPEAEVERPAKGIEGAAVVAQGFAAMRARLVHYVSLLIAAFTS